MNAIIPTKFNVKGPQPLVRTIPAGADYPIHALGPLKTAVEAVQGKTQAPFAIPVKHGGQHKIENALFLRKDLHWLFDRGLITVNEKYQIKISPKVLLPPQVKMH